VALLILDAGPLVALLDRREKFHAWSREQFSSLRPPLITCDAVLTEAFHLTSGDPRPGQQLRRSLQTKLIVSTFDSNQNLHRILELMEKYRDIPMSFADACLVCMVENNPGATLFTLDRDFTIYRQQRRRIIPLIAPF